MPVKKDPNKPPAKNRKQPPPKPEALPRKKYFEVIRAMVDYAVANGGRYPEWREFAAAQSLPVSTVERLSTTPKYTQWYGRAIHKKVEQLDLTLALPVRARALAVLSGIMNDIDATPATRVRAAECLLKESNIAIARLQPTKPETIIDAATMLARDGVLPTQAVIALQTGLTKTVESMRLGCGDAGLSLKDLQYIELEIEPLDDEPDGGDLDVDC